MIDAEEALRRLKEGNARFRAEHELLHDFSSEKLIELTQEGQEPFATLICCSDSRVVPEHIFHVGLGELFVIRVAGNVIGPIELESVLYACDHLDTKLVVVLGHTHCGAVASALSDNHHEPSNLTAPIREAIGETKDPHEASWRNMQAGVHALEQDERLQRLCRENGLLITGALYSIDNGEVEFLEP